MTTGQWSRPWKHLNSSLGAEFSLDHDISRASMASFIPYISVVECSFGRSRHYWSDRFR